MKWFDSNGVDVDELMSTVIDYSIDAYLGWAFRTENDRRIAWAKRAGIDRRKTPRNTPDRRYTVPDNEVAQQLERERLEIEK